LRLTVQSEDYERGGIRGLGSGSGNFVHDDPIDGPPARYAGEHTIHTGGQRESYLVLPVLPAS
ncbi:MAG TPA: peptidase S15, partial [Chloroflexota bacterium]